MVPFLNWKRIVFIVSALAFCLLAYVLGGLAATGLCRQVQPESRPTINGLYIDPKQLDLGEVWATPCHRFSLTIENLGSSPRTIARFQTTCSCLQLEPEGRTLAPGEKAEFSAQLLLMPRQHYERGTAQWPTAVRLDPVFKENLVPTPGWQVTATVRNRVSIDSAQLVFTDQCTHRGPPICRKVRIKCYVPSKSLRATADSKWGEVRVKKNAEQDDYAIFVTPNPSLAIGPFRFDIKVSLETNDGEVYPCPMIEAAGEMQPTTVVMPRVVFLGDHKVPGDAEADVTLKLPANDWKIDHIETDSAELQVSQAKDSAAGGIRLHLKQKITKAGDSVSKIKVLVRKPDKEIETVPVEVRYSGGRR